MTDNKEPKKFKDDFNYESIDAEYVQSKKIKNETFEFNKVETARYLKFRENHHNCLFDEKTHESKFGASGGGISIIIEPTGIGNCILCKCQGCNYSVNITDFDSF